MKIITIAILFSLIVKYCFCELKFVLELFRHGARGPESPFYDGKL